MCSVQSELNDKRKSLFKWLVYCFWFISDSGRKNHNVFALALRTGERTDRPGNNLPPHPPPTKTDKKFTQAPVWMINWVTSWTEVVNWDFMDDHRSLSLPVGGSTEWKWHGASKAQTFQTLKFRRGLRPRCASEGNCALAVVSALAYTRPAVRL